MTDLSHQKKLTNGKGWKNTFVGSIKGTTKKITTKFKNVVGGIKAAPKLIKRGLKNE